MKISRKIAIFIISIILTLSLGLSATYAWIGTANNTITTKISGRIVQEYFHSGLGTQEDPFRITRPIHYYHLVEFFQRETELELTDEEENAVDQLFGTEYLYFALGATDMDRDGTDDFDTPMFYAYDDSGDLILDDNGDPTFTDVLNMAYYSGTNSLMPIGSSEVPFYGAFLGNGLTVSNLSIISSERVTIATKDNEGHYTYEDKDRSTADIGIFGYVREDSGAALIYFDNVTISLVDTDASASHETLHTAHDNVYVGYLAGHISLASAFVDVYINNCTITGGNAAITNFSYFGRVDDDEGNEVTSLDQTVDELYTTGSDAGFGGSLDMYAMYNRVFTAYSNVNGQRTYYPTREIVFEDEDGHEISRYVAETAYFTTYSWNSDVDNSSFYFKVDSRTNSTSQQSYIYISGQNGAANKTVYTYRYDSNNTIDENVYLIHSGDNYLSLKNDNGTYTVRNTTLNDATKWIYDENTHYFYTYVPDYNANDGDDDKIAYYLNRNGSTVTVSTTGSTAWTLGVIDGQYEIYNVVNSVNYYLIFNDNWEVTATDFTYVILDDAGNRIQASTRAISNATTNQAATKWAITNLNGSTTSFYTSIDNERYYLGIDNGLALVEDETIWYKESNANGVQGSNAYYCMYNGAKYYLTYDEGWKAVCYDGYELHSGDNYLSINDRLNSVVNNNEDEAKRKWQLSNPSGATTVYYAYNGVNHYLSFDESNYGLIISDTPTTWNVDANGFYYTVNGYKYYIVFEDNNWTIKGWIEIKYSNNLLAYSTQDGIYSTTTSSANTSWSLTDPSGNTLLVTKLDGVNYYLTASRNQNNELTGDLEAVTSINAGTIWLQGENNTLFVSENGKNYYIAYVGGEWKLIAGGFGITDGSGHYLSVNQSKNGVTNANNANSASALWYINNAVESTAIFAQVDGANYYLGCDGALTVSQTYNTWYVDENGAYYTYYNNIKYYLYYDNGWTAKPLDFITISDDHGNYLAINNSYNGLTNTTNANSEYAKWYIIEDGDNYSIAYVNGSQIHYLSMNLSDESLVLSNTAVQWRLDEEGYYQSNNGNTYHIAYDNGWRVVIHMSWYIISSGTHYLALNTSKNGLTDVSDDDTDYARWQYTSSDAQTTIYCEIDGTKYYLGVESDSTFISNLAINQYTWNVTSNSIYTAGTEPSYLTYDYDCWKVVKNNTYYIKDNDTANYLSVKTTLDGVENRNLAGGPTRWYFESTTGSGKICTLQNGKLYYLMMNNNHILTVTDNASSASSFSRGSYLNAYNVVGTNYYMTYDEGWVNSTTAGWICTELKYLISYNSTNYLCSNGSSISNLSGNNNTTRYNATKWTFSSISATPSGTIQDETGKYLNTTQTSSSWFSTSYALSLSDSSVSWTAGSNRLYRSLSAGFWNSSHYIRYNNGWIIDTSTTNAALTYTPTLRTVQPVENRATITISINYFSFMQESSEVNESSNASIEASEMEKGSIVNKNATNVLVATTQVDDFVKTIILFNRSFETSYTGSVFYLWTRLSTQSNLKTGRNTYFPLKVDANGNVDLTNTGYIIGGGYYSQGSGDSLLYSDLRISKYIMSQVYKSIGKNTTAPNDQLSNSITYNDTYDSQLQVITRTYLSNGYVRIEDNYNKNNINNYNTALPNRSMTYEALGLQQYDGLSKSGEKSQLMARYKLYRMLMDGGNKIYGLHFMNSQINKDHKITVDKAVINEEIYYNFELPEDAIDFTIPRKGSIAFFAGTFFNGNESFFSLHEIFRDPANHAHIADIKEIRKIYGPTDAARYQRTQDTTINIAKKYYAYNESTGTYARVTSPNASLLSTYYEEVECPYVYLYDDGTYSGSITNYQLVFDLAWITEPDSFVNYAMYYFEIPVNEGEFALGSVNGRDGAYLVYLDIAANSGDSVFENVDKYGNDIVNNFKVEYRSKSNDFDPEELPHNLFQFEISAPANAEGKFDINVTFDPSLATTNGDYDNGMYILSINNTSGQTLTLVTYFCDDDGDVTTTFPYAYQIVVNGVILQNENFNYWKSCESHEIPSS